ncbi:MAG: class I SAM-dependent methyltransferase [Spirochaetaceae bacterium]|jgi:ubiquinone/menaquinone biosynthesis C-methylase UbiE|nr:class I SAM-dependent methyltransferase [Spirochaetaceae bacterium]
MGGNFWKNFRKPRGAGGWFLISTMNLGHGPVSRWGLKHLNIRPGDHILDIGCGGGKNVAWMLKRAGEGKVCGLDYSEICVKKTKGLNRRAVREGRAEIRLGSVSENPWPDNSFDVVTAFETIYFWPDFAKDLLEVRRVLKPGGVFFICNEMNRPEEGKEPYQFWTKKLGLKTYTQPEFQKYLTGAGFTGVEFVPRGKSGLCVRAAAGK